MGHQISIDIEEELYYDKTTILGLALLYNKKYHGDFLNNNIEQHYILQEPISNEEFSSYNNDDASIDSDNDLSWIEEFEEFYQNSIDSNYEAKIDILYIIIGPNKEYLSIIKTFWLKLIQRTWKKIYKIRKDKIKYFIKNKHFLKR